MKCCELLEGTGARFPNGLAIPAKAYKTGKSFCAA
jgi:hypothetical protein